MDFLALQATNILIGLIANIRSITAADLYETHHLLSYYAHRFSWLGIPLILGKLDNLFIRHESIERQNSFDTILLFKNTVKSVVYLVSDLLTELYCANTLLGQPIRNCLLRMNL